MNYAANTILWRIGSLVLHDADAKRPEMLMRVLGYARNGECKTQYATRNAMNGNRGKIWLNPMSVLHDPARFGVGEAMKAERPGARDATIETGAHPPGSMDRVVSLRPNEVMLLMDHYRTLARKLEEVAEKFGESARYELMDLASDYKARAIEIREQANGARRQRPNCGSTS